MPADELKKVTIYTDGACSGNPGPGGWGTVLIYKNTKKELCGYEKETTNNRMELTAVINGLSALKEKCSVDLYSDSAYIVNAVNNGWLEKWIINGWRKADKKPVENSDLWTTLSGLMSQHIIEFKKVKGHADSELNNRCDFLATNQIKINTKK